MKILIAFLIMASFCFAAEREQKVFEVSKVKSDKTELKMVFERVQKNDKLNKLKKLGTLGGLKVLQVIDKKEFLVNNWRKPFYLITLEKMNLADGDFTPQIWWSLTNETKTYTTALGVKKTVRVLREIKTPESMTKKEFVTRLKAGETWSYNDSSKCKACRGHGTTRKMGQKAVKCRECDGKGISPMVQEWLVKW